MVSVGHVAILKVLVMFFEKMLLLLKENIGFWRSQGPRPMGEPHNEVRAERGSGGLSRIQPGSAGFWDHPHWILRT